MKNYPALKKALTWLAVIAAAFLVYWTFIRSKPKESTPAPVVSVVDSTYIFRAPDTVLTTAIVSDPQINKHLITNIFKIYFDNKSYKPVDSTKGALVKMIDFRDSSYGGDFFMDTTGGKKTMKWGKVPNKSITWDFNLKHPYK